MSKSVLLTRQQEDNQRLAEQLQQQGVSSESLPLLELAPLTETGEQRRLMLELDRYQVVIVVSRLAAILGLQRLDQYWPQTPVGIDWLAVGPGSAKPLQQFGLPVQLPGDGQDSEALLRLPLWQAHFSRADLKVLIWRGLGGREHLADQVRAAGGKVDYLELYERRVAEGLSSGLSLMAARGVGGIVVLSSQSLLYWHEAAGADWERQRNWRCWVPSARVAAQATDLGCHDVVICKGADDAAIVEAVRAHPLKD
ncbi:uroporphyrinogen-III synthase [Pseudomonas neustonica]|uniref:Uroporphyrinogen-III synthase n=1 Tax=Pseudomonas neustonica TaxID=2487346 RepID=A0ABX9XIF9_9PSED|nr:MULTISPECIES: uroporphyrinogen-III synthase [Pseudomonas]ROZ83041.1 uroporphyrinogen-III synthase [Pseudomonas sp. SSM44]ROZ84860.1 uroporphyrinogen-III synthase [Pseudomonas neustonica]